MKTFLRHLGPVSALFGMLLCGACAAPQSRVADPELPYPPDHSPEIGDILHLPTGYYVSEPQMLAAGTDARIVYVGETHDNPAAHRVQLRVLKAMAERYPGQVSLGMEMFTPAQQKILDAWVAGELTEKEFLKEAGWYRQWRMDFAYYRPLLNFARERKIPVVGLNAEKSLVRTVGRGGLQELSAEQREQLPEMNLGDPYQKALVEAIYGGHEAGSAMLEGFLRVQTLWDETMAQNVARYLDSPQGEDRRMMVVAGGNHIRYGFGIPRRVFRRLPTSYTLIGSKELKLSEEKKQTKTMDVDVPSFPMPAYDYLVFTEYEDLGDKQVKMGVMLKEGDGEVVVGGVLPNSPAAAAGVEKGDVLIRFDGQPIRESFDIVYEVSRKKVGDRVELIVERDGERKALSVVFDRPAGAIKRDHQTGTGEKD